MQICAHLLLFWCFFGALPWCSPYAFDLILVFLGKNGAPGWCKICAHLVLFFQHGAPGWCKMCPHLAFFPSRWCSWLVHNLCSSGVFSSKLCSWLLHSSGVFSSKWFSWLVRNLCPSDLFFFKMVLLARLLAGATCVLIWCFPSKWCSWLVQNLLMLPQQRSRQGTWFMVGWKFGAFLVLFWADCGQVGAKCVLTLCSFSRLCSQLVPREEGWRWMRAQRMWGDSHPNVGWTGGAAQGELVEKLAQGWPKRKIDYSSRLCRPFWGFIFSGAFLHKLLNAKPFLKCYWAEG